jgi:hypothetical protein
MLKLLSAFYHTILFYGAVLLLPYSPGTLAWKLFRNKKGKLSLLNRDLICDSETLLALPKSEVSLDEFTTAFSPFVPLLTLNGQTWKSRRKILVQGLRKINFDQTTNFTLPCKKGDIYWDVFEILFKVGFELIFGRPPTLTEYENLYPGIVDINCIIKRHAGSPNMQLRWNLYHQIASLLNENNSKFIFFEDSEFYELSEMDQVSIIVEDLLTSICIQCTDLVCHLLLLYSNQPDSFKNIDYCINETLRLYPLTDIWTRKSTENDKGWIASLIQLNRSGWDHPDEFKPERWNSNDHPQLISWGFDTRGCPATKIGYQLSKHIFQNFIENKELWIASASNFKHQRTFPNGCQMWIGKGNKPTSLAWKYQMNLKTSLSQWISSRLRMIDQRELW